MAKIRFHNITYHLKCQSLQLYKSINLKKKHNNCLLFNIVIGMVIIMIMFSQLSQ